MNAGECYLHYFQIEFNFKVKDDYIVSKQFSSGNENWANISHTMWYPPFSWALNVLGANLSAENAVVNQIPVYGLYIVTMGNTSQ